MKKLLLSIGLAIASVTAVNAQTYSVTFSNGVPVSTNTVAAVTSSTPWYAPLEAAGKDILNASNVCVAPYATLMTSGAKKGAVGGGLIAFYDFNNYVAAGAGVDYLGSFEAVSGNIQLKLPIHPLSSFGLTNFVLTPFAISALGTPLSGAGTANSSLTTVEEAGFNFHFAQVDNWNIGASVSYGTRSGAGAYSGTEANAALTLSKGF